MKKSLEESQVQNVWEYFSQSSKCQTIMDRIVRIHFSAGRKVMGVKYPNITQSGFSCPEEQYHGRSFPQIGKRVLNLFDRKFGKMLFLDLYKINRQ